MYQLNSSSLFVDILWYFVYLSRVFIRHYFCGKELILLVWNQELRVRIGAKSLQPEIQKCPNSAQPIYSYPRRVMRGLSARDSNPWDSECHINKGCANLQHFSAELPLKCLGASGSGLRPKSGLLLPSQRHLITILGLAY